VTFSTVSCFCLSNQLYFKLSPPRQKRHPERSAYVEAAWVAMDISRVPLGMARIFIDSMDGNKFL
jgi:hypothetical protein